MTMIYTVFFVCTLLYFIIVFRVINNKQRANLEKIREVRESTKGYVSFYSGTLTIKKRDANIARLVGIIPYKGVKYTDTPEKLVYTSATVGRVTTGGWHKTGGFQVKELKRNSGKVKLVYYYEYDNQVISKEVERIKLSDELANEAQSSNIKEYLKDDSFIICEKADTGAAATAAMLGYKDYAFNFMEEAKIAALPTYEKCSAIVKWLSGEAPSVPTKYSK